MERSLDELVRKLVRAQGDNLRSVVLYGSAASGEFRPGHSDLNVLCVLREIGPATLTRFHAAFRWWTRKGHPAPLVFTLDELEGAAGVYAIELLEIKANHQLLFGEDVFTPLSVPMGRHREQVQRELRHNLIRLRQGAIAAGGRSKRLLELMLRSASTFALLFRHCLIALGEEAPPTKHEGVARLAALLVFDTSSFQTLFEIRMGHLKRKSVNASTVFPSYLEAVTRATEEMDRRLNAGG